MYNVVLSNLAPDARSLVPLAQVERHGIGTEELVALLRNFCAVDPVENTAVDAEIRVKVRNESYLILSEQGKLILYDAQRRELPAQIFTVDQALAELDGSSAALRNESILAARTVVEPAQAVPVAPVGVTPSASKPRVAALVVMMVILLAAIIYLAGPFGADGRPEGFVRVESAERAELEARLAGVYLTGNGPGQHGIVVTGPGELKLFELGAVEAPRVVYATYQLGRVGPTLCLATDQPGGVIEVTPEGNLNYCAEAYQRVP